MCDVTILVAEDHAAFRELACAELQRRPDFRVVAVEDGLSAVQAAGDLRPGVVLLDIGMPGLNGLAAGRRIREVSPSSRIAFLTQESSPDVVQAALDLEAAAYINKLRAHYTLPIVEAILDRPVADSPGAHDTPGDNPRRRHQVHFWSAEDVMLDTGRRYLSSALAAGDAAFVMTTRPHWQALCERLRAGNTDVDRAIERGSVVYFDAADAAALIAGGGVANGRPLLQQMVESAAAATGKPQPQVAVFSECAPHLCAAGHVEAALGLEDLGNEFLRLQPIDFLCAYPLEPPDRMPAFRQICARHSAIAVR